MFKADAFIDESGELVIGGGTADEAHLVMRLRI